MDLQDLNAPLPKPWLNIKSNVNTSNYNVTFPKRTTISTNPQVITPAQMVGGIIISPIPTIPSVINTPSASEYKTFFGSDLADGMAFQTEFYVNTTAVTVTINLGTGITRIGGGNTFTPGVTNAYYSVPMTFVYNLSGNTWTVYADQSLT